MKEGLKSHANLLSTKKAFKNFLHFLNIPEKKLKKSILENLPAHGESLA